MASDQDVVALLEEAGLPPCGTITQTDAQEKLQVPFPRLSGLHYDEAPNTHNERTPMKLYDILEVGRRALEVHGGPQCDLGQAVEQLRLLWQSAAADEAERQARRASIAAESRQRAQRLAASTPAQRLCKQLQVAYDSKLTKTRAMELFALEAGMLAGVPYESKPNPRNPRFAPMRLYRAEDVAQRALRYRTLDLAPATPQGN